jgi:hypothetical protein
MQIDTTLSNNRIKLPYPHVKVLHATEALSVVLPVLPKGELAVLCEYSGTLRKIGSVSPSPLCLEKLVRVTPIEIHKDANSCSLVTEVGQLLDVGRIYS